MQGEKRKLRPESFADHYSQARQFYRSQTTIEQRHIADALSFELSRCEVPAIRERMLTHLPNIDPDLGTMVAEGLGMDLPEPAEPAVQPVDLPPSDALSIMKKQVPTFRGRKMGIVLSDGVEDAVLDTLMTELTAAGAVPAIIAPRIGGVVTRAGVKVPAMFQMEAAPSALFDAVAVLVAAAEMPKIAALHAARSFAADAIAHGKFIGMSQAASALFAMVGVEGRDAGMFLLEGAGDVPGFVSACAELRYWPRIEG